MNRDYNIGDEVVLSPFSRWVDDDGKLLEEDANPLDMVGKIIDAEEHGFADGDVYVLWENGNCNSYTSNDFDLLPYHKSDIEYDACLQVDQFPMIDNRVIGIIFGDKKERFDFGTSVSTSGVVSIIADNNNWFIKTRNTTYKLYVKEINDHRSQMSTHEFAKLLLSKPDLPLHTCRYEGDLEGEYEMQLSEVCGVDFGIIKGRAVVCSSEYEIGITELEDLDHRYQK